MSRAARPRHRRLRRRHELRRRRRRRQQRLQRHTSPTMGTVGHTVAALGNFAPAARAPLQVHRHARLDCRATPTRARRTTVQFDWDATRPRPDRTDSDPVCLMFARRVGSAVAALLVTAGLLFGALLIAPSLLGWERYVIVSGSMTGTYDRGSLVFDEVVPTTSLKVGDVITYRPPRGAGPEGLVTHRIAKISKDPKTGERVFRTKGDANKVIDPWTFTLARQEAGSRRRRCPARGLRTRGPRPARAPHADRRSSRPADRALRDGRAVARRRP